MKRKILQLPVWITWLILSLSHPKCFCEIPVHLSLHERLYTFSTYFMLDSGGSISGNIVKTKLSLRTSYQYYDHNGQEVSCAYMRLFSLGSFFTWAAAIDVYDAKDKYIGYIQGTALTFLPSKFSFYDSNNDLVGIAYMDEDCMGFTVFDSVNETKTLANFRRIFVEGITDYWDITLFDLSTIDPRLLLTFGAFAVDHQAYFREDN